MSNRPSFMLWRRQVWVGAAEVKPAGRSADGGLARVEFEAQKVGAAAVGPRLFMYRAPLLPRDTPEALRDLRERELNIIKACRVPGVHLGHATSAMERDVHDSFPSARGRSIPTVSMACASPCAVEAGRLLTPAAPRSQGIGSHALGGVRKLDGRMMEYCLYDDLGSPDDPRRPLGLGAKHKVATHSR